jgi:hypothetical protein
MTIDYPAVIPWVGYNVHYLEDIVCLLIDHRPVSQDLISQLTALLTNRSVTTPGSYTLAHQATHIRHRALPSPPNDRSRVLKRYNNSKASLSCLQYDLLGLGLNNTVQSPLLTRLGSHSQVETAGGQLEPPSTVASVSPTPARRG